MIPSGVEVYVASTPVDFRKGPLSLMALVRDGGVDPFNGALYVFRSKRADRVKIVWWDGGGICLFAKTLEKEQFCWPRIAPATVRLNYAQLLALVDGMDWKKVRPITVQRPQSVGGAVGEVVGIGRGAFSGNMRVSFQAARSIG
jgi:transposase